MSPLISLRLTFAFNGLGIAVWFPRIPDVKAALEVDLLILSLCFFMLPLGTMLGFFVAPGILSRIGAWRACRIVGPLFILAFVLPALARNAVELGVALFVAGLTVASIEVAMNAKAVQTEDHLARRIMTSCHGCWSLGTMVGALLGGGAAALGLSFLAQQMLLAPVAAALAWWVARYLLADDAREPAAERPRLALPKGAMVAVCLLPMGALMIEGAMMEWSALHLRGSLDVSGFAAGVTFAAFALAMALSRFAGDALAGRWGDRRVLLVSVVLMGAGIAGFSLAPNLAIAALAAAMTGLGAANIYPLAILRAAHTPGGAEKNIATLAFVAFTVFLIGPPFIGAIGDFLGLATALFLLTPVALAPLALLLREPAPDESPAT
ncbi:MAG: MFS transporter [Pseudomonadota bacterium]